MTVQKKGTKEVLFQQRLGNQQDVRRSKVNFVANILIYLLVLLIIFCFIMKE